MERRKVVCDLQPYQCLASPPFFAVDPSTLRSVLSMDLDNPVTATAESIRFNSVCHCKNEKRARGAAPPVGVSNWYRVA
jgi:hypothetical protein